MSNKKHSSTNNDWADADNVNNQQQLPGNQLSNTNGQDVDSIVRDLVTNVQSQDLFSNPPPPATPANQKSNKRKKNRNSQHVGMLPKLKANQQIIFNNCDVDDNGDSRITVAMLHNATRLHRIGQGSSSSSSTSSSVAPITDSNTVDVNIQNSSQQSNASPNMRDSIHRAS